MTLGPLKVKGRCNPSGFSPHSLHPWRSAWLQTNSFQSTLILAWWRLLVGNTQVAIYSLKHQSWPKYTSAAAMTVDPGRSSAEALRVDQGRVLFCCVIRNIWTILKRHDGQRR